MENSRTFEIVLGDPAEEAVAKLLRQSEAYAHSLYPPESVHMLPVAELTKSHVRFMVARDRHSQIALGCCALVLQPGGNAELKRMFVEDPRILRSKMREQRKLALGHRGVGAALMEQAEVYAHKEGVRTIRFETGPDQPHAIALGRKFGYQIRGPYDDYPDDPNSVFMQKQLHQQSETLFFPEGIHMKNTSHIENTDGKILVIVDGYSSGSQLPTVMRELGWQCVHVQSQPDVREYFLAAFKKQEYLASYVYDGNLDALVQQLKAHAPSAVQPGTESGVPLADLVAKALSLPGNPPETSSARRNKYDMHNRLAAAGVRCVDHYLASDVEGLVAWANKGKWPVVAKPPASAGSDSVTFCANEAELIAAFNKINGATSQLGEVNNHVLAQRLLIGQEYFINGVSGDGVHVITEIWRTEKINVPGKGLIFDKSVLLDPTSSDMAQIVKYCGDVFDALGIVFGATHTELMVDVEGVPTLIECASRLSGGLTRGAPNYAVGKSQLDLVGNLVVNGPKFVKEFSLQDRKHSFLLWQIQFISDQSGTVVSSHYEELMKELNSKYWIQRAPKVGDTVTRTIDLFSSPGIVFMSHHDPSVMQADYEKIRRWEKDHQFFAIK